MDDTAVKQLYLFHGGSDSGKTVYTLLEQQRARERGPTAYPLMGL
jgi:hypothetical protein